MSEIDGAGGIQRSPTALSGRVRNSTFP